MYVSYFIKALYGAVALSMVGGGGWATLKGIEKLYAMMGNNIIYILLAPASVFVVYIFGEIIYEQRHPAARFRAK